MGSRRSRLLESKSVLLAAAIVCLAVPVSTSHALTIDIPPTVDAAFIDGDVDGTFEELRLINPFGLQTTAFDQGVNDAEVRGVVEYDLSAVPTDRALLGAYFVASITATGTPNGFTELSMDLLGYDGDGQVTFDDITAPTVKIGTFVLPVPVADWTVRYTAALDLGFVSTAVKSGGFLGLMTRSEFETGSISVGSLESYPLDRETALRLVFVPEPASWALSVFAVLVGACWLRRGPSKASFRLA